MAKSGRKRFINKMKTKYRSEVKSTLDIVIDFVNKYKITEFYKDFSKKTYTQTKKMWHALLGKDQNVN